ncbi:MAG TPA: glycosyltransferase family 9 protein [Steroidobacteraceae bacterium]
MDKGSAPLVVRCGAMGDMVLVLSLVEALHRRFGTRVDVISSGGWTRPLLERQPAVGQVFLLGSRKTPYLFSAEQRALVAQLRERGTGPAWIADRGDFAPRLLRRAGVGDAWQLQVARDCPWQDGETYCDRFVRFARMSPRAAMDAPAIDAARLADLRVPPLHVLPQWREDVAQWLRSLDLDGPPLYLVQAGNKRTMRWWAPRRRTSNTKYWPEENWAQVIATMLAGNPAAHVILLGVPSEAALNDRIVQVAGSPRVHNAANALPMPRLLALQERAAGMVSVDTGPAHSGAALGCPLVVLFGEADAVRYAPRSPSGRVEILVRPDGATGVAGITVDAVRAAWQRLQQRPA